MIDSTSGRRVEARIRPVPKDRLRETCEFVRDVFGFSDLEAIPPSHLYTTGLHGAVVIGAFEDERLVGHIHAFPGVSTGRVYLYASGLAVRAGAQSRGLGRRLMFAMRDEAITLGYDRVRWTTDALIARNLYLYLARCRARLVAYHPLMYAGLYGRVSERGIHGDDAEFDWAIRDIDAAAGRHESGQLDPGHPIFTARPRSGADRRGTYAEPGTIPAGETCLVEVPWDASGLEARDLDEAVRWRESVRDSMTLLLEHGFVGTDGHLDRMNERAYVRFSRQPEMPRRDDPDRGRSP